MNAMNAAAQMKATVGENAENAPMRASKEQITHPEVIGTGNLDQLPGFVKYQWIKPPGRMYQIAKRIFDLAVALAALILLVPVFLAIGIAIKCKGPDVPVFIG